jgi:hypothetical protein
VLDETDDRVTAVAEVSSPAKAGRDATAPFFEER